MKKLAQFKCIRMGLRQNSGPPSLGIWAVSDFDHLELGLGAERAARRCLELNGYGPWDLGTLTSVD